MIPRRGLAVGLVLAWFAGAPPIDTADGAQGGPPPSAVRVGTVERRLLQERRKVTGTLRAVARAKIATIEPGLVVELPVVEGQIVKAGDKLAVLDDRRLKLDVTRLDARRAVAVATEQVRQAELSLEQRDVDALRGLASRGATNPKELADAESMVAIAEARLIAAQRDLEVIAAEAELARTRLSDTVITAPFDGVIISKNTEHGQWVAEGDAIAEMIASGVYHAWLDVPQRFVGHVTAPNAMIHVEIEAAGRFVEPTPPTVVPLVDATARTFNIFVPVADPENQLAPGMSVTGWVPTGARAEHLTLPRDALLRNQAGFFVYVARRNGPGPASAVPVKITVLFEVDDRVAVAAPELDDGDQVVVEGNERLFPMMPITFDTPGDA
jgi:RND family efflux transporter MFP subunit